ncbi:aminodeoxychorismate synthase component I [Stappia sp. TSB10GB4]|uniref:aminodeoxychorismate synthase component I n=1 Tax=Stappia sp. TSB10GB4 TaxID=2003584 RepID=UPI001647CBB6|nr:aminodeoxychorismate synthase component I [Stappia sp. TSB10GB4]
MDDSGDTGRAAAPQAPADTLALFDAGAATALLFAQPRRIIACHEVGGVEAALAEAEAQAREGFHVAGYIAYEAGFAFEDKLQSLAPKDPALPLLRFGVYEEAERLTMSEALARIGAGDIAQAGCGGVEARVDGFELSREEYDAAFAAVREHLAKGDIYQANLTMRARGRITGDPAHLFARLLLSQPVGHAAFLRTESRTVLSLSPELFLERRGTRVTSRPMKGTAPRGRTGEEDRRIARLLASDPKSQAENVMIVDLMRNDLSRIAQTGSVKVPRLFEVEPYATLFQMTSTVEGKVPAGTGFAACMRELFPCGSITGAPKLSAMQIIHKLESGPRGIYTGGIGHLEPSGDFRFNVAIRTLVVEADGRFEAGAGSGLVFDSASTPEYDECRLKLAFLERRAPDFSLFETMAWQPAETGEPAEGYLLLERHLSRLINSAARLGFPLDVTAARALLARRAGAFEGPRRVRLELAGDGKLSLEDRDLPPAVSHWTAVLADVTMPAGDPLLWHKTTRREIYDGTRARLCAATGCDEVIFANDEGYLTEGSFTTLFVARGGRLLTPALRHGLLPGTLRAALLESGRAVEADLRPNDLASADKIYLGNSLRGLVETRIQSRATLAAG